MNHIMLRCKLAGAIWTKLSICELATASLTAQDILLSDQPAARFGKLWHIYFAACVVALWNARNTQVFHGDFWNERYAYNEIVELI